MTEFNNIFESVTGCNDSDRLTSEEVEMIFKDTEECNEQECIIVEEVDVELLNKAREIGITNKYGFIRYKYLSRYVNDWYSSIINYGDYSAACIEISKILESFHRYDDGMRLIDRLYFDGYIHRDVEHDLKATIDCKVKALLNTIDRYSISDGSKFAIDFLLREIDIDSKAIRILNALNCSILNNCVNAQTKGGCNE